MESPMPSDQAALQRCEEELAKIKSYEEGPPVNDRAILGALWRADWEWAKRIIEARIEALGL